MKPKPASPARPSTSRPLPKSPMTVAGEQAQRHQPPEGGIAEALAVGAVERRQQREGREHRAGERVEPVQRDHWPRLARLAVEQQQPRRRGSGRRRSRSGSPTAPARAARGCSRRSRASAGSARSSRSRRRCPRRRTGRHCRSRRNRPSPSPRSSSSSSPCCFSAAASAIGATSGRTVCGWPAVECRPIAAVIWR